MHYVTFLCVWIPVRCYLIYFALCQISPEQSAVMALYSSGLTAGLAVYGNCSPCIKASSYLQRRWPFVAPTWTWGQCQSEHCRSYLPLVFSPVPEVMISSHWSSDFSKWVNVVMWAATRLQPSNLMLRFVILDLQTHLCALLEWASRLTLFEKKNLPASFHIFDAIWFWMLFPNCRMRNSPQSCSQVPPSLIQIFFYVLHLQITKKEQRTRLCTIEIQR